jgi:hypothetical protein
MLGVEKDEKCPKEEEGKERENGAREMKRRWLNE